MIDLAANMTNGKSGAKLESPQRELLVESLDNWVLSAARESISKSFCFGDFVEAFAFMTRVALLAERLNHHPEWSNVYDRVEILLTTHDVNGLSDKDISLAHSIDQIALLNSL